MVQIGVKSSTLRGSRPGSPRCAFISAAAKMPDCGGPDPVRFIAIAINAAVSSESGLLSIPTPNYLVPSSFGSLELRQRSGNEFIGQAVDYTQNTSTVRKLALDEFNLPRLDLIKIDIEGMELEALEGAKETIGRTRPIMLIEKIKTDAGDLRQWLTARGYELAEAGINTLAIHASDRTIDEFRPKAQPSAA